MILTELSPSVLYLLISGIAPKVTDAIFLVMKKIKVSPKHKLVSLLPVQKPKKKFSEKLYSWNVLEGENTFRANLLE